MLIVKTLDEARIIIEESFEKLSLMTEWVVLEESLGRVIAEDITSEETIPAFTRSCMDGYAVVASETFGACESIPVILKKKGSVAMGTQPDFSIEEGTCAYVPTGGAIPHGADGIVMIEYTEDYGDGTIGVYKATAPGKHFVYRGDDVKEGTIVLKKGSMIGIKEIGILADLGIHQVPVKKKPVIGIFSTGDELVNCCEKPVIGQIRDVNAPMLIAAAKSCGCEVIHFGILKDNYETMLKEMKESIHHCNILLISGGTSVGEKDLTAMIIEELGEILIHGLAVKPGKPTIVGKIDQKPVFGMPGHPVATFLIFQLLTKPLIHAWMDTTHQRNLCESKLRCAISSNQGREEYIAVKKVGDEVMPIISKSGLIATLMNTDGFLRIERDCEGYSKGDRVLVELF